MGGHLDHDGAGIGYLNAAWRDVLASERYTVVRRVRRVGEDA
jgi:hypothetical protein